MNKIFKIKEVNVLNNFGIKVIFEDGLEKTIYLKDRIGKGVSKPLLEQEYFKKVNIDSSGGLYWPNGYDICPVFIRENL